MIERALVISVIIAIGVVISVASVNSMPSSTAHEDPWAYETMRTKLIETETKTNDFSIENYGKTP